ncbi:histidine phosphatase family protein [Lentilactobacillus kisonensis]|uniref:Phosphoglycerate mutase family protein n=1 Tax=Lentilactobacillus kisonensis DSM 19906 = JCM 15041 TaxID=1423766 RepID=A0A0R1NQK8_9LACO|nr:histidine phosphatase family protein [Lentilactobacillus kisonensis]KRL22172.1 phosphoglycerate mutase family protein [Lentilactobacillus kisonensis DSM 19906 = JCM 15041]
MKLLLSRHGETTYNREKKYYGKTDVELDDTGLQQADQLAEKLKTVPINFAIRSDLKRTEQTLKAVERNHSVMKVIVDKEFDEMPFGNWEGKNANEVEAAYPDVWEKWLKAPFDVTPEGAEPFHDFEKRVIKAIDHYLMSLPSDGTILLVAHLGVLRTLHHHWYPDVDWWSVKFNAGDYSLYEATGAKVKLIKLNV